MNPHNPVTPSGYLDEVMTSLHGIRPLVKSVGWIMVNGRKVKYSVCESLQDARRREGVERELKRKLKETYVSKVS